MTTITRESPLADDLALLFQRHHDHCHAETPPESIHMMPAGALDAPDVVFLVVRDAGRPVGMGAVKTIAPGHGELKSMHILSEYRGRGLSRRLLDALTDAARDAGLSQLSLETGTEAIFAPARALYVAAGFTETGPFGAYRPDPNSAFFTRKV
ncbi:GNAT family N-acetyltransferase [Paracoccus sp. (in: a-proteobacteria)]|uniref:GNAT family N-acetyltransferase n=1 Tax=Paracoccus sp. TaxID=267 RepID=UPI0026E0BABD|nr:GNAT family N-acetyltransferase [Paracoccus sp. (in: a-proteobacteria)]MDO5646554.1 GNAT family N-acetyltransferase [Paracoccus sp. (in: a-proteobacteria)]